MMTRLALTTAMAALALSACNQDRDRTSPEEVDATDAPDPAPAPAGTSILRPDVESEIETEAVLDPVELVLSFDEEGRELTSSARGALTDLLESDQIETDWPIILSGHSDSGGSDDANLRASTNRAETVRDLLVEAGVDGDRITIIAFGEQNPLRPNANPDGTPNERNRARNRRVELAMAPQEEAVVEEPPEEPSAAEAFSGD